MKYALKFGLIALGMYLGYIGIINPGLDPWIYVCFAGGACMGTGLAIR